MITPELLRAKLLEIQIRSKIKTMSGEEIDPLLFIPKDIPIDVKSIDFCTAPPASPTVRVKL